MKYNNRLHILLSLYIGILMQIGSLQPALAKENLDEAQKTLLETIQDLQKSELDKNSKMPQRLLKKVNVSFNGQQVIIDTEDYWYYPSQIAIQEYAYETIYFNQHSDTIDNIYAVSKNLDDEVFWLNNKTIKTIADDSYNTFSETKNLIINYPGMSSGSITGISYTRITDMQKLEGVWSRNLYLNSFFDQKKLLLTIHKPSEQSIYYNNPSKQFSCKETDAKIECEGNNIPALEYEQNLYFGDITDQFIIGLTNSWDEVKSKVLAGFRSAQSDNDGLETFLNKRIDKNLTKAQKIDLIHDFVARDIRYLSMSEAGHAITPHSVRDTLNNRYGDCKDKTTMLLEMLQQIGINAWPVLVATERRDINKLTIPSTAYFNHVIACFDYESNTYCIDATDTASDWRYTSAWNQGKVGLSLVDKAPPFSLNQTPYKWDIESSVKIDITSEGGQNAVYNAIFKNEYAAYWRSQLELKTDDELKEWAKSLHENAISSSGISDVDIEGVAKLHNDIKFSSYATFDPYLSSDEELNAYESEVWVLYELNSFDFNREYYDSYFPGLQVKSTMTVNIPTFWTFSSYPANLNLVTEYGRLKRKIISKDKHTFQIDTVLTMPAKTLAPSELESIGEIITLFKEQSNINFAGFLTKDKMRKGVNQAGQ